MKLLMLSLFAAVVFVASCSSGGSDEQSKDIQTRDFIHDGDQLFAPYMTGDIELARRGLKQAISHYEESSILDRRAQAGLLELDYDRLYVLERRVGNVTGADLALIKARYWRIRSLEASGVSDAEALKIESLDTPDNRRDRVDKYDKGDGKSVPKYLHYLGSTNHWPSLN